MYTYVHSYISSHRNTSYLFSNIGATHSAGPDTPVVSAAPTVLSAARRMELVHHILMSPASRGGADLTSRMKIDRRATVLHVRINTQMVYRARTHEHVVRFNTRKWDTSEGGFRSRVGGRVKLRRFCACVVYIYRVRVNPENGIRSGT